MIEKRVLEKIKEIVGKENFFDSPEERVTYSYNGTPILENIPDAVVRPSNVKQLMEIVSLANEEKFGIVPRGSGTGLSGGSIPSDNSIVLLLNHWNQILEIDAENLTATVEPGVITEKVHQEVEKIGLFYPPDPGSASICTIGGNVAENAGGLRGLKYGVTRNYVMGLEVILPTGAIINIGGKVVKNAAGYSLKEIFVGSEGTLAIFTKILLKLIPKPEQTGTLLAFFERIGDAGRTVSSIISSHIIPSTLEFLDGLTIKCVEEYTGIGLPINAGALLLIEVDGPASVVEYEAEKIEEICLKNKAIQVKRAKTEKEAVQLKAARKSAFSALARIKPTTILEDVTVPRSEVANIIEKIQRIADKYHVTIGNFGHAGDGNLHPTCLTDERDKEEIERAEKALEEIFRAAVACGGTITGEHGVGLAKKRFLPEVAGNEAIEIMRKFKTLLDPNNVLNPGKVISVSPKCEGINKNILFQKHTPEG